MPEAPPLAPRRAAGPFAESPTWPSQAAPPDAPDQPRPVLPQFAPWAPPDPRDERDVEPAAASGAQPASSPEPNEAPGAQEPQGEEAQELAELERRDTEVRAHEQAHLAAAGPYARSGASFDFQVGPDGQRYAVGGEVSIDLGEAPTPEQTILKAQVVRRAALAPAEPSAQDRRVAAMASAMESQAKTELAQEQRQQVQEAGSSADSSRLEGPESEPRPRLGEQPPSDVSTPFPRGETRRGDERPIESAIRGQSGAEFISRRAAQVRGAEAYRPSEPDSPMDRPNPRPAAQVRPAPSTASLDARL